MAKTKRNSKRTIRNSGKTGTLSPSKARRAVESVGRKRSSEGHTVGR